MRNRAALLGLAFALLGAACGPGAAEESAPTTTIQGAPPTSGIFRLTTTSLPEETSTTSGRPVAPDFTLQLGEGGSYTLSEGAKPVYLVFWAEW